MTGWFVGQEVVRNPVMRGYVPPGTLGIVERVDCGRHEIVVSWSKGGQSGGEPYGFDSMLISPVAYDDWETEVIVRL